MDIFLIKGVVLFVLSKSKGLQREKTYRWICAPNEDSEYTTTSL